MLHKFHAWLYPEIKLFPTERGWRAANIGLRSVLIRRPGMWRIVVFIMLIPLYAALMFPQFFAVHYKLMNFLLAIPFPVIAWAVRSSFRSRNEVRRELRELLREQGIPICIPCGYNLTGIQSPRCPECGEAFGTKLGDVATNGTSLN